MRESHSTDPTGRAAISSRSFPEGNRLRRRAVAGGFVGLFVALVADARILRHEKFLEDPVEDLALGATTASGALPDVLETSSGLVSAPRTADVGRVPSSVYGGARTDAAAEAAFALDGSTDAPAAVSYHEPFRPATLPFKRLYAFDALSPELHLTVAQPKLERLPMTGRAEADEDLFFGDVTVDLAGGRAVRIPSVGPGSRVLAVESDPPLRLELYRDGAENWFLRGERETRVRLLFQLALRKRRFEPAALRVSMDALGRGYAPLPERMLGPASRVLAHLGLSRETSPAVALEKLVAYFRGFRESDVPSRATTPEALYEELTFARRGVCRHRAFAFFVTARALGLGVRVVQNEAHAWVEVFDGELHQRLDLGGAPVSIHDPALDPRVANYVGTPDPFVWPNAGDAAAARRSVEASESSGWPMARGGPAPDASGAAVEGPSARELTRLFERASEFRIELSTDGVEVRRGGTLSVRGRAFRRSTPCRLSRIDLVVRRATGEVVLGALPTNARGEFAGELSIPADFGVGVQRIEARLGAGCEP